MITKTIQVPYTKVENFRKSIEKYNKKATKHGIDQIEINIGSEFSRKDNDGFLEHGFNVNVTLEPVMVNGYTVKAILKRTDDIVTIVSGSVDANTSYDHIDFRHCDHCNTRHLRRKVVVLESDNNEISVGMSCVKEYLGITPNLLESFTSEQYDLTDGYNFSVDKLKAYSVKDIIAHTFDVVSKNGGYFGTSYDTPTAYQVKEELVSMYEDHTALGTVKISSTEKAVEFAENAIMEVAKITPSTTYEYNIVRLCGLEYVSESSISMVASIYACYARILRERVKMEEQASQNESQFVGEVKQRITVTATLTNKMCYDGYYGMKFVYILIDEEGNAFKVESTRRIKMEEGQSYTLVGTVKKHNTYIRQDFMQKQTVLNRVKVQ